MARPRLRTRPMDAMSQRSLEMFWQACQARAPLELLVRPQGSDTWQRRTLATPFAVIGRDPDVDLRLDHPDINRRHAYLQVLQGRVFVVDLQSRTRTHWEDGSA